MAHSLLAALDVDVVSQGRVPKKTEESVTGHEDHEALLTKTPLSREPGPAGIPTARASIARRAAGGLIVKLVIST